MTGQRLPPAIAVLVFLGLLAVLQEVWPSLVPAFLGLAALYLLATNVERAQELLRSFPRSLGAVLQPQPAGGTSGRPPLVT